MGEVLGCKREGRWEVGLGCRRGQKRGVWRGGGWGG